MNVREHAQMINRIYLIYLYLGFADTCLGYTHYILRLMDPDKEFSGLSERKIIKNKRCLEAHVEERQNKLENL